MFETLLIANRGEIACRVIATAKRLGLRTVAVYSDADAGAKHVAMADQAVRIGPASVAESYLLGDTIIKAALKTGAQAIHPGYGFLSENPDFVEAVEAAGLCFVGPPAAAIRAMGLKDAAKTLMAKAGVPVVPGYHGADQDPARLAAQASAIGYPVLIKARAGGGGKGMRLVDSAEDFQAALESAQREAQASFGDPACLIEKYITQPRHIEIQVFGDSQGSVVHLFERDCSLQRRHQKVIEEAPAPDMPQAVRAAMGRAAVEAAKAIGYQGAGTVEFIADGSGPLHETGFWFMEMNTRLQVEHPVSEAITGLDFVELQLRLAAGEPLPFGQDDLHIQGHAFEARLYAEDAAAGFLPATGRLQHLSFPDGTAFRPGPLRIDSGVRQGDEISPWYDPMIAKIITHGPSRAAALNQLRRALGQTHVAGTTTNLAFLGALTRHQGFAQAQFDTGLIARDLDGLTQVPPPPPEATALAALAAMGLIDPPQGSAPFDSLRGYRHWSAARQAVALHIGDEPQDLIVTQRGEAFGVAWGDWAIDLAVTPSNGPGRYHITGPQRSFAAQIACGPGWVSVMMDDQTHGFGVPDPLDFALQDTAAGADTIAAPMPGLVKLVSTTPGATIRAGAPLLVLEAMKMEHTLTAPRDGTVAQVLAQPGDQVRDGVVLIALEPQDG